MEYWPILKLVPADIARKITAFHVFCAGNLALFITTDDEVHAVSLFGKIDLDDSDGDVRDRTQKINSLCDKEITAFSDSGTEQSGYILALAKNGKVFMYDYNNSTIIPSICKANLDCRDKKVVQMASGDHHSVLLTFLDGQCNELMFISRKVPGTSHLARFCITKTVVSVSCTSKASAFVTEGDKIYTWGLNAHTGHTTEDLEHPRSLPNLPPMKKVSCGVDYMLALSTDGDVFGWGNNEKGQLGMNESRNIISAPRKLPLEPIIVAHRSSYTSAALSAQGEIFVWGDCNGRTRYEPVRVSLPDLDSVFACLSSSKVTRHTIHVKPGRGTIYQEILGARDDPTTCDVIFNVENRRIYAHKYILKIRCGYFRAMFTGEWKETNQKEIEVTDYSYDAYKAYVDYIYTGELDVSAEIAEELLPLAQSRFEEEFTQLCEKILIENLMLDNLAHMLDLADIYKLERLKEMCLMFAKRNFSSFVKTKSFQDLDKERMSSLLICLSDFGAFKCMEGEWKV